MDREPGELFSILVSKQSRIPNKCQHGTPLTTMNGEVQLALLKQDLSFRVEGEFGQLVVNADENNQLCF